MNGALNTLQCSAGSAAGFLRLLLCSNVCICRFFDILFVLFLFWLLPFFAPLSFFYLSDECSRRYEGVQLQQTRFFPWKKGTPFGSSDIGVPSRQAKGTPTTDGAFQPLASNRPPPTTQSTFVFGYSRTLMGCTVMSHRGFIKFLI